MNTLGHGSCAMGCVPHPVFIAQRSLPGRAPLCHRDAENSIDQGGHGHRQGAAEGNGQGGPAQRRAEFYCLFTAQPQTETEYVLAIHLDETGA
jgi:hypothetical protein